MASSALQNIHILMILSLFRLQPFTWGDNMLGCFLATQCLIPPDYLLH